MDEDEAYTTRRTPASRAAVRRFSVPVTLFSFAPSGSSTDRGTERMAAWWKITSTPRAASAVTRKSRRSPSTTSSRESADAKARCSRLPEEKLSRTRTRWPSRRRRSTTWEPINPAPPVTRNMQGIIGGRLAPCQRDKATKERYNEGTKGGLIMKRLTILASVLIAATLLTSPALAQQPMGPQPGQPPGQPPTMGPGMMGGGQMGPGMGMGQSMMMCPMMHQMMHQMMMGGQVGGGQMGSGGMMGMMGGQMDPKTHGRMLQMRGEMLKAAGDILLKHGKMLEEGK